MVELDIHIHQTYPSSFTLQRAVIPHMGMKNARDFKFDDDKY